MIRRIPLPQLRHQPAAARHVISGGPSRACLQLANDLQVCHHNRSASSHVPATFKHDQEAVSSWPNFNRKQQIISNLPHLWSPPAVHESSKKTTPLASWRPRKTPNVRKGRSHGGLTDQVFSLSTLKYSAKGSNRGDSKFHPTVARSISSMSSISSSLTSSSTSPSSFSVFSMALSSPMQIRARLFHSSATHFAGPSDNSSRRAASNRGFKKPDEDAAADGDGDGGRTDVGATPSSKGSGNSRYRQWDSDERDERWSRDDPEGDDQVPRKRSRLIRKIQPDESSSSLSPSSPFRSDVTSPNVIEKTFTNVLPDSSSSQRDDRQSNSRSGDPQRFNRPSDSQQKYSKYNANDDAKDRRQQSYRDRSFNRSSSKSAWSPSPSESPSTSSSASPSSQSLSSSFFSSRARDNNNHRSISSSFGSKGNDRADRRSFGKRNDHADHNGNDKKIDDDGGDDHGGHFKDFNNRAAKGKPSFDGRHQHPQQVYEPHGQRNRQQQLVQGSFNDNYRSVESIKKRDRKDNDDRGKQSEEEKEAKEQEEEDDDDGDSLRARDRSLTKGRPEIPDFRKPRKTFEKEVDIKIKQRSFPNALIESGGKVKQAAWPLREDRHHQMDMLFGIAPVLGALRHGYRKKFGALLVCREMDSKQEFLVRNQRKEAVLEGDHDEHANADLKEIGLDTRKRDERKEMKGTEIAHEDGEEEGEGDEVVIDEYKPSSAHEPLIVDGDGTEDRFTQILKLAIKRGVLIKKMERSSLDNIGKGGLHQGLILEAFPIKPRILARVSPFTTVKDESGKEVRTYSLGFRSPTKREKIIHRGARPPMFLMIDHIVDPQNLGACIRTASYFGFKGAIIAEDLAAPLSPAVSKASSGAMESLPIYIAESMTTLARRAKRHGWWVVGAQVVQRAMSLQEVVEDVLTERRQQPVLFIIGNEARGIKHNLLHECHTVVKIPTLGSDPLVDSLNVSVATGIIMNMLTTLPTKQVDSLNLSNESSPVVAADSEMKSQEISATNDQSENPNQSN